MSSWRESISKILRTRRSGNQKGATDPLFETAVTLAKKYNALFLDEFMVTDIADAMIVRRLFDIFWKHGLVLIVP